MNRNVSDNTVGGIVEDLDSGHQIFSAFSRESASDSRQVFRKDLNGAFVLPSPVIAGQDSAIRAVNNEIPVLSIDESYKVIQEMNLDQTTLMHLKSIMKAVPRGTDTASVVIGMDELNSLAIAYRHEPEFQKAVEVFGEILCRAGFVPSVSQLQNGLFVYRHPKQGSPSLNAEGKCQIE